MAIMAAYFIIIYKGGENSYILVHDNLDSTVVWYKLISLYKNKFFSLSSQIPNIMNGMPISSLISGINIGVLLHVILGTIQGIIVNEVICRMVAFWGMYLLIKGYLQRSHPWVVVCVSLCFALLPFYPGGFLGIAGQPLLLYSFLNIRDRQGRIWDWIYIIIYPFYSSLTFSGFAVVVMISLIPIIDLIKGREIEKKYWIGVGLLCGFYMMSHYRLFAMFLMDNTFVSHRTEFIPTAFSLGESIQLAIANFRYGHYHAASLQNGAILASVVIAIVVLILGKKTNRLISFFTIILACLILSGFYGMWKYVKPNLPGLLLLKGFQWERFHVLHPLLWHLIFASALGIIMAQKNKYGGIVTIMVILLISFQMAYAVMKSHAWAEKRNHGITFAGFFAESLFADISSFIGQSKDSYKVASLGLHPAIAQYNGFYTVDGYMTNYSLEYKRKFRKIIADELSKNNSIQKAFDHWGSRCYLFSSEIGYFFLNKKYTKVIRNLELDTASFMFMGGRYILSSAQIMNAAGNGLVLRKVFEKDDYPWCIWLYEAGSQKSYGYGDKQEKL